MTGALIINADDWGRDPMNTDRILDCIVRKTVSSASAMVFMEDSERSAELARRHNVDAGLHLNLTTPFSGRNVPSGIAEQQLEISAYLRERRANQAIFNPRLAGKFRAVVTAQLEEYERLYQHPLNRVDGHHHMHLSANVLFAGLLPSGTIARRNFSFLPGEKSFVNRAYRKITDSVLSLRHTLTDFFFSLPPLEPQDRLGRILSLSSTNFVEVETHPISNDEYEFLMNGGAERWAAGLQIAPGFRVANGTKAG